MTEPESHTLAYLRRIDEKLDRVEDRLGRVEGRLEGVEGRLGRIEDELLVLKVSRGAWKGVRSRPRGSRPSSIGTSADLPTWGAAPPSWKGARTGERGPSVDAPCGMLCTRRAKGRAHVLATCSRVMPAWLLRSIRPSERNAPPSSAWYPVRNGGCFSHWFPNSRAAIRWLLALPG
jgi:hypothetical protein